MKKLLFLVAVILFTNQVNAEIKNKQYELELSKPNEPMFLYVDMRNGSVNVEGYDGKTVEIVASFSPLSPENLADQSKSRKHLLREEARKQAKQQTNSNKGEARPEQTRRKDGLKLVNNQLLNLEIREDHNKVRIDSEHSTFFTTITVKVPSTANVEIDLFQGGEIKVSNISGSVELESLHANITAHNISGPIVAETNYNDIEVIFTTFNSKHPTSFNTYSGDIDVKIAKNMAANMNVQNYKGQIYSGIDEEFSAGESIKQNESGRRKEIIIGGQMTAKINGGGQDVSLITYSGDVYIRK